MDTAGNFLEEVRQQFAAQRSLAERAIAQLADEDLFRTHDADANSIAILMQHVGGNLRSRWTEPLTTDGEKPDRNRDGEFEVAPTASAAGVRQRWAEGWSALEAALDSFSPHDVLRTVTVRGERLSLMTALLRSLGHTAQHVGQVVLLARMWKGPAWQTLSIPRGRSADFARTPPVP